MISTYKLTALGCIVYSGVEQLDEQVQVNPYLKVPLNFRADLYESTTTLTTTCLPLEHVLSILTQNKRNVLMCMCSWNLKYTQVMLDWDPQCIVCS